MSIFRFVVIPLVFLFVLSKPSDYITALFYKQAWWLWVIEDCLTVITILIGSEGGFLIAHRLERYIPWEQGLVKRFVVQIVLQGIWFTVAAWSGQMLNEWCFDRHTPNKILLLQVSRTVALALFFMTAHTLFQMFQRSQKLLLETEELKRENISAQVEALKHQLDPHFLFNSLNTLTMLVLKDQQLAVQFIKRLSEIYRYVLRSKDVGLVSLEEEITFVRDYLFLAELRFGHNLDVSVALGENWKEFLILPMTAQMLIENAMKHNVISSEHPLRITIGVEDEWFVVCNSVFLRQRSDYESESTQIGLDNIRRRYQLVAQAAPIVVQTANEFTVKVPLLRRELEN